MVNLIFLTAFFFALHHVYSREEQVYKSIKFYWYGTFLLSLTGIWQLLSFYNLLSFPFDTRTKLHSVGGLEYLAGRLTGISMEPSHVDSFIKEANLLSSQPIE